MTQFAIVFPGQGSQSLGMLSEHATQYSSIKETFAEASDAINFDLWQLTQKGPESQLNQTEYTQMVMLTADVALYRILIAKGLPVPKIMAGHSLGEYAALVCSNALTLEEAIKLVRQRGQLMQNATPLGSGAMAAIIGLDGDKVVQICEKVSTQKSVVMPANYNAHGQTVIAGHVDAVNDAIKQVQAEGIGMAVILPISVPCHCHLLRNASETYANYLTEVDFKIPDCVVLSNVDVTQYNAAQDIRTRLAAQLYSPVQWVKTIEFFAQHNIQTVLECGPGRVLSGLIKRTNRSITTLNTMDSKNMDISMQTFMEHCDE